MKKERLAPPEIENWIGIGDPDSNQIFVWGQINESMYSAVVETLIECSCDTRPLEIYVSTQGGDTRVSMVIADIIERLKIPTTIYLIGEVYSAGFILPLAGYRNPNVYRIALPSSRVMWHSGEVELVSSMHAASDWFSFQQKEADLINQYIIEHSKITPELLETCWRQEYYMLPEEMLELGIVDEIL